MMSGMLCAVDVVVTEIVVIFILGFEIFLSGIVVACVVGKRYN